MKIKLTNNLSTTRESRGISTWTELSERLEEHGYSLGRTTLARHAKKDSPGWKLELIEALCNEFQCLPNDLFNIEITDATEDDLRKLNRRSRGFEFGSVEAASGASVSQSVASESSPPAMGQSRPHDDDDDFDDLVGEPLTGHLKT